jgi:glycosyltransferase involved in cell wall biosynthesis
MPQIQCLGLLPRSEVLVQMKSASVLVFPSECYETCPLTILEAFATGLPVVGSDRGAIASIVRDGETGVLFNPGSAESLADKVIRLHHNPVLWQALRRNARAEFERLYSREGHYERLLGIYQAATDERSRP